jgi:hypothetical protein
MLKDEDQDRDDESYKNKNKNIVQRPAKTRYGKIFFEGILWTALPPKRG